VPSEFSVKPREDSTSLLSSVHALRRDRGAGRVPWRGYSEKDHSAGESLRGDSSPARLWALAGPARKAMPQGAPTAAAGVEHGAAKQ